MSNPPRLLIMGTGPFAVPMFQRLLTDGRNVLSLVTRPDRPVHARGSTVHNPMRELARSHGLPVFEPEDVNSPESREEIAALAADLLVVCDFGQILSRDVLAGAPLGGINLHGSLLPKYRGAAPIQWAVYHGETTTGVSVIHMTPRLDAGPVLVQRSTPIGPDETAADLEPRLAALGADAVREAVAMLAAGEPAAGIPQDPALASKAPRLKKTDGLVDWRRPARAIYNQFRAMQPWPKIYSFWHPADGSPMRVVLESIAVRPAPHPRPLSHEGERGGSMPASCCSTGTPSTDASHEGERGGSMSAADVNPAAFGARPGEVVATAPELLVATGEGAISISRLQAAGKRSLSAAEFLRGHAIHPGDHVGPESLEPGR